MLLLLPRADLRGEAVHGDHGVHVAAEVVKILLVEGEDDVGEIINEAPARLSTNTPNHLDETTNKTPALLMVSQSEASINKG